MNTTPTQFKSMENFIAYDQLQSDYKNLVAHYEEFKTYKKGTRENAKAYEVCYKYISRIITNKKLLGFDIEADKLLLEEIITQST